LISKVVGLEAAIWRRVSKISIRKRKEIEWILSKSNDEKYMINYEKNVDMSSNSIRKLNRKWCYVSPEIIFYETEGINLSKDKELGKWPCDCLLKTQDFDTNS